jgi:hypothetical protein
LTGVTVRGILCGKRYGNEVKMRTIKNVLEEELKKALRLQEEYD